MAVIVGLTSPTHAKVVVTTGPAENNTALPWTPTGPPAPTPAIFVDGDNNGGVGVWSTATGALVRTLSPQTAGGPDQQATLSADRRTVYFVQPTGSCTSAIERVPVSAASRAVAVIHPADTLALEPSPSPDGRSIAWIGSPCRQPLASQLHITDLATDKTADLGPIPTNSDNGIAWSPDGHLLAVENGRTVVVADLDTATPLAHAVTVPVTAGCSIGDPVFIAGTGQLAVNRTCTAAATRRIISSSAITVNPTDGRPLEVIATAPNGSRFVSLSVDHTGQHILVGVDTPTIVHGIDQADTVAIAQVVHGTLVTITAHAPTAAEW